jgi:hypothetical protein
MKTKITLSLIFGLAIAFTSCTKDDDEDSTTQPAAASNAMVIDGTTYPIGDAFLFSYADGNVTTPMDLIMFSDGFTIHYDENNLPDSISGSGFVSRYLLFSTDSTNLTSGTYLNDTTQAAFTYSFNYLAVVVNGKDTKEIDQSKTTMDITYANDEYTIAGDARNDSASYTFSYQGPLFRVFR